VSHHTLTVEVIGGAGDGIPIVLVSGLTDDDGQPVAEATFVVDGPAVRLLQPSRSSAARRAVRPLEAGLPSLSAILRFAVE
jgi:hypothetical protein